MIFNRKQCRHGLFRRQEQLECYVGSKTYGAKHYHHLHYIIKNNIINIASSTRHHQDNTINTTPSTHHHQHNTINTTPSLQHHQHNTINTTPSTQHQSDLAGQVQHAGREVRGSPATIEYCGRGRHSTWSTSVSFYVAGAAAEHLSLILRGRCNARSTSRQVRGSPATIGYCERRLLLRGRRSTWSTSVSSCVAGNSEHLSPILRGRRSTRSTSILFCVAGASLGAPEFNFVWQVQHAEHLSLILRGKRSTWST